MLGRLILVSLSVTDICVYVEGGKGKEEDIFSAPNYRTGGRERARHEKTASSTELHTLIGCKGKGGKRCWRYDYVAKRRGKKRGGQTGPFSIHWIMLGEEKEGR